MRQLLEPSFPLQVSKETRFNLNYVYVLNMVEAFLFLLASLSQDNPVPFSVPFSSGQILKFGWKGPDRRECSKPKRNTLFLRFVKILNFPLTSENMWESDINIAHFSIC